MTEPGDLARASGWGDEKTRFFFELTPERVLESVESGGLVCTGRCMALNSFENRVYDVEIEEESETERVMEGQTLRRRVVKFYRPGRWTREQIIEEHQFIADLRAAEIPAIPPLEFPDGQTLRQTESGMWYAMFPKVGGRAPDEMKSDQLRWIGRLLARMHAVGAAKQAPHRIHLTPETYGLSNLEYLLQGDWIPIEFRGRYQQAVLKICETVAPWFKEARYQRVHGDCHLGNLLWGSVGGKPSPFFLDFDDMVNAPAVQDIWLLLPGRPSNPPEEGDSRASIEARQQLDDLLEGYEEMKSFDWSTIRLIEPLRALRFVHYTAWIARRWQDPAFPQAFPQFGSHRYWNDETEDLEKQLRLILRTRTNELHNGSGSDRD